jgi:hypothetical protein
MWIISILDMSNSPISEEDVPAASFLCIVIEMLHRTTSPRSFSFLKVGLFLEFLSFSHQFSM